MASACQGDRNTIDSAPSNLPVPGTQLLRWAVSRVEKIRIDPRNLRKILIRIAILKTETARFH